MEPLTERQRARNALLEIMEDIETPDELRVQAAAVLLQDTQMQEAYFTSNE